jgi:hypothetical protein
MAAEHGPVPRGSARPAVIPGRGTIARAIGGGRGPRAQERRGDLPPAPLRAVRPPSPEATFDPEPGDSCLAKLGPAREPVNTSLWMTLWATWGDAGVSLWTSVNTPVEFAIAWPALVG